MIIGDGIRKGFKKNLEFLTHVVRFKYSFPTLLGAITDEKVTAKT